MELLVAKQTFKRISEIEVPDKLFQTSKTDSPELDSVFSEIGGLVPSQVILVTGNPGSGKTTLCAVVGSRIAKKDSRPVVFLSYEMSDFQLKLQARKIAGFDSLLVSTHEFHAQPGGIDLLFQTLDCLEPSMVIVDSLQKMASKMPDGPTRGQIVLVEHFTKWAKRSFVPVMLIGHNDKGGNYSGPAFLKHEVDSHMTIWFDQEIRERLFSMSKNRFGGNMESYPFRITPDGVFIGSEWWNQIDAQGPDGVRDMIIDYKSDSSGDKINWEKFKNSAEGLIRYLNQKHSTRFANQTFVGTPEKVSLSWEGKRATCTFKTGQINLGSKFFANITADTWKWVGYRSERPFISEYVKNKEEAALWVVLHEWVHLFKGYQHHTKKMWKEISRIASEESWMWNNAKPANA